MTPKKRITLSISDFATARKELADFETKREQQIRRSRDIIQLSKKIIYSVHRDDLATAKKELAKIKKEVGKLSKTSYDNNMVFVALQEYVEAAAYYEIVAHKKLPTREQLNVSTEEYLAGICDLCGELVRRAVNHAAQGNREEVIGLKLLVEDLFGEFLQFDFRNGELRKKSDSIKYHLNKLENLVYEISMR